MFIEHEDDLIALSQIKKCKTDRNFNTVITLTDGNTVKHQTFYTAERIAKMAAPIVQAQPGYFKIEIPLDESSINDDLPLSPVVGWRIIGEFDFAEPITVQMSDDLLRYAVLAPDGTVYEPGGRWHSSRAAFMKALQSE
jgi:hypothetical protein